MSYAPVPPDLKFPTRASAISARWVPIYTEPVVGSGERIAIGVAAYSDRALAVAPVSNLSALRCVYGKHEAGLSFAAEQCLEDIRARSRSSAFNFGQWVPPAEGIEIGTPRLGEGNSLEEIAEDGLRLCSSLFGLVQLGALVPVQLSVSDEQVQPSESRLEGLIKSAIVQKAPNLERHFGRVYTFTAGMRPLRLGFSGRNLAANFASLAPTRLAQRVRDAKSKLWDLRQVKDYVEAPGLVQMPAQMRFELIVHRTSRSDPNFSERQVANVDQALKELEYEADRSEIRCRSLLTVDDMANVVIEAEAA